MADTSNVTAPQKRPQDELQAVRKPCLSVNGMAQAPALFIFDATILGGLVVWSALLFNLMARRSKRGADHCRAGKYPDRA